MRKVFVFKKIINEMWKHKKIVGISIIVFAIVSGLLGVKKIRAGVDISLIEEGQEYEENLAEYDELIEELKEDIEISKTQIQKQQEYCDNSVYMQLDAQKIYVAEVQYGIKSETNIGNIMNSLVMYINEGSLQSQIHELYQNISVEYLKELISCSISGNVLHVAVMAPEEQQAHDLMQVMKTKIIAQKEKIASFQGNYGIQELDSIEYVKADATVLNTQNTALTNLKSLKNSLSDYEKKLIERKADRTNYIENNTPNIPKTDSPAKVILKFMIFGIALGILVPMAWFSLLYVLGNTVKGKEELFAVGLPVFGMIDMKKDHETEIALNTLDIQMLAEKEKSKEIFLNGLSETECSERIIEEYSASLTEKNQTVVSGIDLHRKEESLRHMIDAGNCILVVEVGKTTYTQIEEQLQLTQKFGISIWGCIIVG